MESTIITIPTPICDDRLMKQYADRCRMDCNSKKHLRILAEAERLYELLSDTIQLVALVSETNDFVMNDDAVTIQDVTIRCPQFRYVDGHARRLHICLFTLKDFCVDNSLSMLQQSLSDTWGALLIDICRNKVEQQLIKDLQSMDLYLSPCFGPGLLGMDLAEMDHFSALVNPGMIQIQVTEFKLLLPLKSCANMYFATDSITTLPFSCNTCLGNKRNCNYCRVHNDLLS